MREACRSWCAWRWWQGFSITARRRVVPARRKDPAAAATESTPGQRRIIVDDRLQFLLRHLAGEEIRLRMLALSGSERGQLSIEIVAMLARQVRRAIVVADSVEAVTGGAGQ